MHLSEPTLSATFSTIPHACSCAHSAASRSVSRAPFFAGCRGQWSARTARSAGASPATQRPHHVVEREPGQWHVPKEFTCDGADQSPAAQVDCSAAPGTKSLVLTVTDPDAPGGTFTHWALYNFPQMPPDFQPTAPEAGCNGPTAPARDATISAKSVMAAPAHPAVQHTATSSIFSHSTRCSIFLAGATRTQIEEAMNTHVLARGKLMARYSR